MLHCTDKAGHKHYSVDKAEPLEKGHSFNQDGHYASSKLHTEVY